VRHLNRPLLPSMAHPVFCPEFGSDHHSGGQAESRYFTDFISRGAAMILEAQTFQYIVQNESGETISGYTSTNEPPAKGDVIKLDEIDQRKSAEVLGVTMLLSKQSNMIVLKVRPTDGEPL
jgi:hypothetical protein